MPPSLRNVARVQGKKFLVHGIDPGFKGAIATVAYDDGAVDVVDVVDMPTKMYSDNTKKSGRRGYDLPKLLHYLKRRCTTSASRVFLESNLIMDSNSLYSTASTAFGAGLLLGIGHTLGADIKFVSPRRWQAWVNKNAAVHLEREKLKVNGKKPDSKQMAELFIKDRLPRKAQLIYGPRGGLLDGRSDAICIAMYGAHIVCQQK